MARMTVLIGSDRFEVDEAKDHQEAKYKASQTFKDKYKLFDVPISVIAPWAKSQQSLEPEISSEEVVKEIRKVRPEPKANGAYKGY